MRGVNVQTIIKTIRANSRLFRKIQEPHSSKDMKEFRIGIRRETKNRWECRVPLTPSHVATLKASGNIDFVIQPSARRVFPDHEYERVGATVKDDLSGCDLIMGVKEVPEAEIMPGKQYIFFSHTHKGQPYNMPLLRGIVDKRVSLFDYELLKDPSSGSRLVAFGAYAGYAGMINTLHGLGDRLLTKGYRTPFLVSFFGF